MSCSVGRRGLLRAVAALAAPSAGLSRATAAAANAGADAADDVITIPTKIYPTAAAPDGLFPVRYRRLLPVSARRARYRGFDPGRWLLKAGTVRREGARPLPVDILYERDVALKLRDGTTIYTDCFRPVTTDRVPAIFGWSPYGKDLGGQWLDDIPGRAGVPLERVSELQRFEGADPAYWCAHGYAVVNPDPRGALSSGGNVTYWGRQMAEDGYDAIEWVADQPWCSGAVVMSGNSWLAASQWFIAAERPPHLAAIAPWEGLMDQGPAPGIPVGAIFGEIIIQTLAGGGYVEDQPRMTLENPTMNAFWQDHRARVERITVPAYIVASYTNPAHTVGTFEAWRTIGSTLKWLRIHNTQEWQDYYDPAHVEDLRRFFDRYAKDIRNGWETTPVVRMAVLDPGGSDIVDRPETRFPPERVRPTAFYLAEAGLQPDTSPTVRTIRYDAESGQARFRFTFNREAELIGTVVLRLWMQADGSDDMDVAVSIRKVPGLLAGLIEAVTPPSINRTDARGLLRASFRELDPARSTADHPVLSMRQEQRLGPGEIVPLVITLSPMAMAFHPGEQLELTVSAFSFPAALPFHFGDVKVPSPADGLTFPPGHPPVLYDFGGRAEASATRRATTTPATRNRGHHVIHMGGAFDSSLVLPLDW